MQKLLAIPFEDTKLIGDVLSVGEEQPHTLFLHGAGSSSRERWRSLMDSLLADGIGSYAFDFIGHGETGGDMFSSSLKRRTEQALEFIKVEKIPTPLTLIGSSMGAYTALKVSQSIPTDTLFFFVPAMYNRDLYEIKFGPQFTVTIRLGNWEGSDAWEILSSFTGKLLVVGAEKDETVPKALTQKIYDSATHARSRKLYFVPEASHALGKFLQNNKAEMDKVISLIHAL